MTTSKNFQIARSPITNNIYIGIARNSCWISKKDVTAQAFNCVLEHIVQNAKKENPGGNGMAYIYKNINGHKLTITVEKEAEDANFSFMHHEEKRVGKSASFQQPKYPPPEPIKKMKIQIGR